MSSQLPNNAPLPRVCLIVKSDPTQVLLHYNNQILKISTTSLVPLSSAHILNVHSAEI